VEDFIVPEHESDSARLRQKVNLGPLHRIRENTSCPLCRLIVKIADRPLDQRLPSRAIAEDSRCYLQWVVDGQEYNTGTSGADLRDKLTPRTRRLWVYSEPQTFKDGYLILLGDDAPSPAFFGRLVPSADLDVALLRRWLSVCEAEHGDRCTLSLVPLDTTSETTYPFRVIDVKEMCIVEASKGCRYITLSYLWGSSQKSMFKTTSDNLQRLSTPGGLEAANLPRTIQDAINFARVFGERYLWVDSLCLVHDQQFQYRDADKIYARAALTVVAGSGHDANAGLPGVRKGSRTFRQEVEEIKPRFRLMVSHLAEGKPACDTAFSRALLLSKSDYIATSQWDSRAWTFQERILSRRCLLFINGRIYFQCRRTTFCEDINETPGLGWSLDSIDMPTRIFQEKPFMQYTAAVELYTRRFLTEPSDILHAFEGVGRVLQQRMDTSMHFGLPSRLLDSALLWESSQLLRRRPGFPSWSWTGWIGEISWNFPDNEDTLRSWIDWYCVDRQKSGLIKQRHERVRPPLPLDRIKPTTWQNLNLNISQILRFASISIFFQLSTPTTAITGELSPLRRRRSGPSTLSTTRPAALDTRLIRAGLSDLKGAWCGSVLLEESWRSFVGTIVELVILSGSHCFTPDELHAWQDHLPQPDTPMSVYNVLLIERHDFTVSRVSIGRVLQSSLELSHPPGPVWREYLLE